MRAATPLILCAGLFCVLPGVLAAQEPQVTPASSPGVATVEYRYERPGLNVPRFRMVVREDGSGTYSGDEVRGPAANGGESTSAVETTHVERQIQVTPATAEKIFRTARAEKLFHTACASKAKNIADTGTKELRYTGPDGTGACTYNYSENKNIVMLTELFLGIATTIDEGRKLEFKHRYDRLGVDAELDVLAQANTAGRAVEIGVIAPVLHELANDADLMQRARLRASKLLDRAAEGH